MGVVFINYRRGQTAGEARALCNDLAQLLGPERVFMDVDNIALGRDFREVLSERLDDCEVMLSLIGHGWLDARSDDGTRRLDNPGDFVRLEIATALRRGIAVTPVMVQGAHMPAADPLPEDIRGLAFRNGFELSHTRWESDVHELVRRLGLKPAAAPASPAVMVRVPVPAAGPAAAVAASPAARRGPLPLIAGAGMVVVAIAAWAVLHRPPEPAPPRPSPARVVDVSRADLEPLIAKLDDRDDAVRRSAEEQLLREHGRSPLAVQMALEQLAPKSFQQLRGGRIQVLTFLAASDDSAWTAASRKDATQTVARLRDLIDTGKWTAVGEARQQLDLLAKRLGTPAG